jgi:hypothetical protein
MDQVAIQLRPDAALALLGQAEATPSSQQVVDEAAKLGIQLEPVHPGTTSPDLMTHFTAYVRDAETALKVAEALRQSDAVEAAYFVPPASPAAPPTELP